MCQCVKYSHEKNMRLELSRKWGSLFKMEWKFSKCSACRFLLQRTIWTPGWSKPRLRKSNNIGESNIILDCSVLDGGNLVLVVFWMMSRRACSFLNWTSYNWIWQPGITKHLSVPTPTEAEWPLFFRTNSVTWYDRGVQQADRYRC